MDKPFEEVEKIENIEAHESMRNDTKIGRNNEFIQMTNETLSNRGW